MKCRETGLKLGLLGVVLFSLGCAARPEGPMPGADSAPNLKMRLAWNQQVYDVPPPLTIPAEMRQWDTYRRWKKMGTAAPLTWTAGDGSRYVAHGILKLKMRDGKTYIMFPRLDRFRPDGTLEMTTAGNVEAPAEWTLYAADGKTPTVRVVNRVHGLPGTPFIQHVEFYDARGIKERAYQANSLGVAYLEWFYNDKGDTTHWNGTSALDETKAETRSVGKS